MASVGSLIDMPANTQKCEFLIEQLLILAVDVPTTEIIYKLVGLNSPWYKDIYEYLKNGTFPFELSATQHKTFICRSSHYTILGDTLHHRSLDGILL